MLVARLGIDSKIGVTELKTKANSQMVMNQMLGVYATKGEKLSKYLTRV